MKKLSFILLFAVLTFNSCNDENPKSKNTLHNSEENLTDNGIKDPKALKIVANTMSAMEKDATWDELKYVSWTFFGSRHLTWDKVRNRVRIETPKDTSIFLVDLNTGEGKYKKADKIITSADDPKKVAKGRSIWINDMYWLFMPFKMTDPGVNLKYIDQDTLKGGAMADVLELTFNKVGDTPENKYYVYIDKSDHLVKQWSFFPKASDELPARIWPWDNYKSYDGLMLSAERSDNGGPSDVKVYDSLEDKIFTEF